MKNDIVNVNNELYQEQTHRELPQTRPSMFKVNSNYLRNPLHRSNTRERVKELRSANLTTTLSEIANDVGISRQRVFQILREEGLPTKHYIRIKEYQYQCLVCGTISPRKFCSDKCKKKWE